MIGEGFRVYCSLTIALELLQVDIGRRLVTEKKRGVMPRWPGGD